MAQPKTVIPRKRRGPHNPEGGKPRKVKDPALLTELEREERAFQDRRKAERENSKHLRIRILAPVYLELLKLCEKFGRDPVVQAELCVELGVRFFTGETVPHGGPRPLEMLPEVAAGPIVDSSEPTIHRGTKRSIKDGSWIAEDAGLPIPSRAAWTPPAAEEPSPEEKPVTIVDESSTIVEAPAEEDIEVTVA